MFNISDTIRPIGIPSSKVTAGVGYITIPVDSSIDRDTFIEDCYRTQRVAMLGGQLGGMFYDVSIDTECIKNIQFPNEPGGKGSPVVWLNIPVFEKQVIVAVLKDEDDYIFNDEHSLINTRSHSSTFITTSIQAKDGHAGFAMSSDKEDSSVDIDILNSNNKSKLNVRVSGDISINGNESVNLQSDKNIFINVKNEKDENLLFIKYTANAGYEYRDEFGNEIACVDGVISIKSKKINHSDGDEPMVLGDKLVQTLSKLIDAINKITVPTALGPSGTPINKIEFNNIKSSLEDIKSKISNLS